MLDPSLQDKTGIIAANFDGTYNSAYPTGDKPGGSTIIYDKLIDPNTSVADRFSGITSGDIVGLQDGVYSGGLKTVPDGVTVRAVNGLGTTFFEGGDDSFGNILDLTGANATIHGIIFRNKDNQTGNLAGIFGTDHIIQECGFEGTQRANTIHKHQYACAIGGSGHLIEDCYAFGKGRKLFAPFAADFITVRRCLARFEDGQAGNLGEPHSAFNNYGCKDMTWENIISIDFREPTDPTNDGGDWACTTISNSAPSFAGRTNDRVNILGYRCVGHWLGPAPNNSKGIWMDTNASSHVNGAFTITNMYAEDCSILAIGRTGGESSTQYPDVTVVDLTTVRCAGDTNVGASANGLADTDKRYVDGVYVDDDLWTNYNGWRNEAIILARMQAYDDIAGGRRGWTASGLPLKQYTDSEV